MIKNFYKISRLILICLFVAACTKSGGNFPNTSNNSKSSTNNPNTVNNTDTSKSNNTGTTTATNITYKLSVPVILNGAHDLVINGLQIQNSSGPCIYLTNCSNITISHCKLGPSPKQGIELYKCTNIVVDSCYIANTATGMYTLESTGIQFNYNQVKNIQGPFPGGQMVQFDNVSGTGNRILNNKCENIAGASSPEDVISMYMSNGTADDPIMITGNWIRGGGPSKVGSGIMLGDNGGSYIIANKNILVNPGSCGIAIAGGNNLQIVNNEIYSSETSVSNVGIYIWNQSNGGCSLNTISNNQVNWTNSVGEANTNWDSGNCGAVNGWNTNIWGASLNPGILPSQIIIN